VKNISSSLKIFIFNKVNLYSDAIFKASFLDFNIFIRFAPAGAENESQAQDTAGFRVQN
jgi:hypothetical protein